MEYGLKHIFDNDTKIIIMGTFPSIKSRGECYYNHPQNQFWKIIAEICHDNRVIKGSTEDRYTCLLKNCIGLWDVIKSCKFEKKSSLDSKIIQNSIKYNDFSILQKECPKLESIVFSSNNAQKLYQKYLKLKDEYPKLKEKSYTDWLDRIVCKTALPSTSPANARMKPADKLKEWTHFFSQYVKK